jgi:AraC family transcriptional regulator, transcriptional activator FtrA
MLEKVAVILLDAVEPFELGVLCEVFGSDRTADGFPAYEFMTCSLDGEPVRTEVGFTITPSHDLGALEEADLIAVPAYPIGTPAAPKLAAALRRAIDRGARVLSLCTGAFLLGEAGLLDGRACTTHWNHAAELAQRYPQARVDPNVLYVVDDNVLTSAGTAAGIDLCLHLIRAEHGSAIATALARRMVVPPHRSGGQAQYVETPMPASPAAPTLEPLLAWLVTALDQAHTVETLAARAHMSERTFARRFRAETGATPHDWLTAQRLLLARRLLEDTDLGIEAIAAKCGFGNAATLRHHFTRKVGATPQSYRTTFKCPVEQTGPVGQTV